MPALRTDSAIKTKRGSVLILVIALLVLLALIGTAYLSSTQTERYTADQNTDNTQADLLISGLQTAVQSQIASGLWGSTASGTSQYRPPGQDQPTYTGGTPTYPTQSAYTNYDATVVDPNLTPNASSTTVGPNPPDLFLGDRLPSVNGNPYWNTFSFPLFTDSSGNYNFDSPSDNSISMGLAVNKRSIQLYPTSYNLDGRTYPGLKLSSNGQALYGPGGTTPGSFPTKAIMAASASGDGITDAGLFKLPIGPINGITYYGAIRVIDGNSAINASSANTQGQDTLPYTGMNSTNYGFFRANIGLQELLYGGIASPEVTALNNIRYNNAAANTVSSPSDPTIVNSPYNYSTPTNFAWYSFSDMVESQLTRRPGNPGYPTPSITGGQNTYQFTWLGQAATAALAYKFTLRNGNTLSNPSSLETALSTELLNDSQSTAYSAAQVGNASTPGSWYFNNFASLVSYSGSNAVVAPLRTVLVGNNAVANAAPSRLGLVNSSNTTPPAWTAGKTYNFGDWVVDGPVGNQRSFVCIQQQNQANLSSVANEPEPPPYNANNVSYNAGAVAYWAGAQSAAPAPGTLNVRLPGMPFSTVPVKTSVNTASFSQLWLAFAQVMTDSISVNQIPTGDTQKPAASGTPAAQWQPPMQPAVVATAGLEQQMGQFRSVIRDSHAGGAGKMVLTSAQMLKLRAAIAAVNTLDLRDSDDDVTSREIVLTDDSGTPQYDVEVYGTEKQPYISEVIIQVDGVAADNYVAIEICNPYPTRILLGNGSGAWQIGGMDRSTLATSGTMTIGGTTGGIPIPSGTYVPAADPTTGKPGLLILENNTNNRPPDLATIITANLATNSLTSTSVQVANLDQAVVSTAYQPYEFFLMRPRLANCTPSVATAGNDIYNESNPRTNLADYVPVDQLDLSGITFPTAVTTPGTIPPTEYRYWYRRANDPLAYKQWQFVYPGCYDPTTTNKKGRYFYDISEGTTAIQTATFTNPNASPQPPVVTPPPTNSCNLGAPTGGTSTASSSATYATVPIQLNNAFMAGPNPVYITTSGTPIAQATNIFPFGAFARNLDMLKIPFIGAYRIRPYSERATAVTLNSQLVTELNSVTIDSTLAYDNSPGAYAIVTQANNAQLAPNGAQASAASTPPTPFNEQIGRFCPVGDATQTSPTAALDYGSGYDASDANRVKKYWHYHWCKRLFDYLTVQAPSDDYYPNVDPTQSSSNATPAIIAKYPGTIPPAPVSNSNTSYTNYQIAGHAEDTVGNEGLININTAPVAVLAQLPFYGIATGGGTTTQNAALAQAIVTYRNNNGPFQSIMDLNRVTGTVKFVTESNGLIPTGYAAGPAQGVFSPGGIGTAATANSPGAVRYDFQDRYLILNNISNLITTHSDTFTCYVLLQGWRNVGTGHPTLAVQRRLAFLVDRNAVTPSNNVPVTVTVPSQ